MWLFTKYGFYSVVCARQDKSDLRSEVDPTVMMIRARSAEHLEALRTRFASELGDKGIVENAGTDYRYRMLVSHSAWCRIAAELADEIDYGNFKDQLNDDGYHAAALRVWNVMYRYQDGEVEGGGRTLFEELYEGLGEDEDAWDSSDDWKEATDGS